MSVCDSCKHSGGEGNGESACVYCRHGDLYEGDGEWKQISKQAVIRSICGRSINEKMARQLKHCPFCGGSAKIKKRYRKGTANRKMFWVECKACWVSQYHGDAGGYKTRERAIEAWNRRFVEIRQYGEGGMRIGIIK